MLVIDKNESKEWGDLILYRAIDEDTGEKHGWVTENIILGEGCKIKNKSDIFKVRGMNKAEPNLRQRFYKVEMNNASITFPDGELLCNNLVMRGSSHIHLENPQDIIIIDVVMDIDAEIEIEGNQNLTITNVDLREYSSLKIKTSGTKEAASVDNLIVQPWNTKTVKL